VVKIVASVMSRNNFIELLFEKFTQNFIG
jgi:hypothetical protein